MPIPTGPEAGGAGAAPAAAAAAAPAAGKEEKKGPPPKKEIVPPYLFPPLPASSPFVSHVWFSLLLTLSLSHSLRVLSSTFFVRSESLSLE